MRVNLHHYRRIRPTLFALSLTCIQLAQGLTLHEAQALYFKNNPDLAILKLETERAEQQYQESHAAWLPSLDAIANYGYTTETSRLKLNLPIPVPGGSLIERTLGDHDKVEFGLDATYPIFTGFARGKNIESKRAGIAVREAQWRSAKNQGSLKLAGIFYAWQLAQIQTVYLEKVLEHSQVLQKQLQDFVKAGTGVRSRALGAEAKSKAAEVDLLLARNTRDSLGFELLDFMGSRDSTGFTATTEAEAESDSMLPPIMDWENQMVENVSRGHQAVGLTRPEIEALDYAVAQAQYGQQALLGQRYPQLFGLAGYRYANPGLHTTEDAFMQYGLLGLQLKWNLFDGAKNRSQRKQLEVQSRLIQEQKRKFEGEWWKAKRVAQVQYARWDTQFEAAKASREAASASAADLKRQFEVGLTTGLEWLEAKNQIARAEMMIAQARTMQKIAVLQWRFAAGKELQY